MYIEHLECLELECIGEIGVNKQNMYLKVCERISVAWFNFKMIKTYAKLKRVSQCRNHFLTDKLYSNINNDSPYSTFEQHHREYYNIK